MCSCTHMRVQWKIGFVRMIVSNCSLTLYLELEAFQQVDVILMIVTSTSDGASTLTILILLLSTSVQTFLMGGQQLEYHLTGEW